MMTYKLIILGVPGVGKTALTDHTSLITQWCFNYLYEPYLKQIVVDGEPCLLDTLEHSGNEEYGALYDQWIREREGFLLVYSITERSTFERIKQLRDRIARVKDFDNVPIMIVGNKCDKLTCREVSRDEGMLMAKSLGCEFMETSAKNSINVERSFFDVIRMIRKARNEEAQERRRVDQKLEPGIVSCIWNSLTACCNKSN